MPNRFLIFSPPFSDNFYFIKNNPKEKEVAEMVSFKKDEKIHFHTDYIQELNAEQLQSLDLNPYLSEPVFREHYLRKDEYLSRVANLKESMQAQEVEKVVFSRIIKKEGRIDLVKTLLQLRKNQPSAFCYLMYYNEVETWIGASPEVLLEEKENEYVTYSLAGTLKTDENWTDKELEEQGLVTQYIAQILENQNLEFTISEIQDCQQGDFKHLKQEIYIPKNQIEFKQLLQLLNPTSAVCGMPKKEAEHLIRQYELHDREFYTGYIEVNEPQNSKAYVNIRCAKIFASYADIFVGGGITALSNPEKEWLETEMKAQIIEKNLVLY